MRQSLLMRMVTLVFLYHNRESEPCIEEVSVNTGYKIVFDNIDKNIKPRFMRSDFQTRSLHYVNSYAVKDRIDFSQFSSETLTHSLFLNSFQILPTIMFEG